MTHLDDFEADRLLHLAEEFLRVGESRKAVRVARQSARLVSDPTRRALNLAAVLIDAGAESRTSSWIREGIRLLQQIEPTVPPALAATVYYNIGNGFANVAEFERGFGPGTRPSLANAASHLAAAVEADGKANARANFAGVLLAQGRWIEAYDEFTRVLDDEPDHHSARARRGSCLMGIYQWTAGHRGLLISALADHEEAVALSYDEPVFQRSYRRVVAGLRTRGIAARVPDIKPARADHRWIWRQRLALNPCPLCGLESPEAFDLYPLARRLSGGRRRPPVEELNDITNAICQAYSVARWSLYRASKRSKSEDDHVVSAPGTPGARHDLHIGLTMAALTGFYGVLSKIGYALNSYYHLGHPETRASLQTIWRPAGSRKKGVPRARADLHPKLVRYPTPALAALHRVALSLEHGLGRYESLRTLRNQIEHHLVVAVEGEASAVSYRAIEPEVLTSEALRIGRIAKAAIWYFGGAIIRGERERLKRAIRRGKGVRHSTQGYVDRA